MINLLSSQLLDIPKNIVIVYRRAVMFNFIIRRLVYHQLLTSAYILPDIHIVILHDLQNAAEMRL